MARSFFPLLATLTLTGLPIAGAAAAPPEAGKPASAAPVWEQPVDAHKRNAARLAAARQWDPALKEIAAARRIARDASHDLRRSQAAPSYPAEYRKQLRSLVSWLDDQKRVALKKKTGFAESYKTFQARKQALDKKYGIDRSRLTAGREKLMASLAHIDLALGELDDLSAAYFTGAGKKTEATAARESALKLRLKGYEGLNRIPEATRQADGLLALPSTDAAVFSLAGQFFQRQKAYQRGVEAWRKTIDLIESGRATVRTSSVNASIRRDPKEYLSSYYRQLAYCYHHSGKAAEARRAQDKATELEVAAIRAKRA